MARPGEVTIAPTGGALHRRVSIYRGRCTGGAVRSATRGNLESSTRDATSGYYISHAILDYDT